MAADNAAYKLRDTMDAYVFAQMAAGFTNYTTASEVGSTSDPLEIGHDSGEVDPLNVLSTAARLLDEANVPEENRWMVAPPKFYEDLVHTSSKLISTDYNNGSGSLRNGLVAMGPVRGFRMYKSNNLPTVAGASTWAGQTLNYILAGHISSTACASHLVKTEVIRDPDSFADRVRGLLVWGQKVLRPESGIRFITELGGSTAGAVG